ncbi:MAG: PrsW family glutamic-type intramembrane protease [Phascolarctobacterium sp.]|nr:PrsW family glutamic-type intramembrane protease [Phascolarctobacterium sp.]
MDVLTSAAVLPGLFLVWYVYEQDKIEKEPRDLLLKLFFFGALTVFIAMVVESGLVSGLALLVNKKSLLFALIENFLCVALVEEFVKFNVLKKTWNHPAFDYRFDGIVYAVVVGMGFAVLENIFYVYEHGMSVAIMRAFTSLPGHCVFAIYMGYYYGEAKLCATQKGGRGVEANLKQALWIPTLLHGFYDFCLSAGDAMLIMILIVFVVALDIRAYNTLKASSARDVHL